MRVACGERGRHRAGARGREIAHRDVDQRHEVRAADVQAVAVRDTEVHEGQVGFLETVLELLEVFVERRRATRANSPR